MLESFLGNMQVHGSSPWKGNLSCNTSGIIIVGVFAEIKKAHYKQQSMVQSLENCNNLLFIIFFVLGAERIEKWLVRKKKVVFSFDKFPYVLTSNYERLIFAMNLCFKRYFERSWTAKFTFAGLLLLEIENIVRLLRFCFQF